MITIALGTTVGWHDGTSEHHLEIPCDREAELVAKLHQRGYEVTRDDGLINVLDGRGFSPLVG